MAFSTNASPSVVIKTSRETLALVVAAGAMTFAISHAVHSKPEPAAQVAEVSQDWAGHLAGLDMSPTATISSERLSSAALVVPKDHLALPTVNLRPLAKLRGCDGSACVSKPSATPPAQRREIAAIRQAAHEPSEPTASTKPGLLNRIAPLDRLSSAIRKPFSYAGEKVAGWFSNF